MVREKHAGRGSAVARELDRTCSPSVPCVSPRQGEVRSQRARYCTHRYAHLQGTRQEHSRQQRAIHRHGRRLGWGQGGCVRALGAHEDELHSLVTACDCLEEDRLGVLAVGAEALVGARQRRVLRHIGGHLCGDVWWPLVVNEDEVSFGRVCVLAVAAHALERLGRSVLLGIKHIAALRAQPEGRLTAWIGIVLDARAAARRCVLEDLFLPGDAIVAAAASAAQHHV